MRQCDPLLKVLLDDRSVRLYSTDIYDIVIPGGASYFWTSYDLDLVWNGNTYQSQSPFLTRNKWNVTNSMQIPELEVTILATAAAFAGGSDLMSQIHNGLLDNAQVTLNRLFMSQKQDTTLGTVLLFGGGTSTISIQGTKVTLKVKGANNKMDQYAPKNLYEVGCLHTFCDAGCTLLASAHTFNFTVGASPTKTFIPWTSAPASPSLSQLGTLTMTSGIATGESRTVEFADSSGCTLSYPLYDLPSPGDTFKVFEGCDKTRTTCGLSSRNNLQNWRGFPFIPPATSSV